jgi:hypothetical protein
MKKAALRLFSDNAITSEIQCDAALIFWRHIRWTYDIAFTLTLGEQVLANGSGKYGVWCFGAAPSVEVTFAHSVRANGRLRGA